jgi:hypothetical protein
MKLCRLADIRRDRVSKSEIEITIDFDRYYIYSVAFVNDYSAYRYFKSGLASVRIAPPAGCKPQMAYKREVLWT